MIRIKGKKEKIVMVALVLITVISLGITVCTLLSNKDKEILAPDYAKPELEENAEPFGEQTIEKYEKPEQGGGTVDIIYEENITIDLPENKIYLMYGNPKVSNHDMIIQIIIKDMVVAESGMIQSGNRVTELSIKDGIKSRLTSGQYNGEIRAYFYDCVSAEKAQVDVKIPVMITVKN